MPTEIKIILDHFPIFSEQGLKEALAEVSLLQTFPSETTLIRENEPVRFLPLLIRGVVKVMRNDESGRELLLYYIRAGESCIASFNAAVFRRTIQIKAITEEESELLLVPVHALPDLMERFPTWNRFLFQLYHQRFEELLQSVNTIAFSPMEQRLELLLSRKVELTGKREIRTTHQELADELGTAREVVSRLLKRMEQDGKLSLARGEIRISE